MKPHESCEPSRAENLILKGGRVLDPEMGVDAVMDVTISNGIIAGLGESRAVSGTGALDCTGKLIVPGFIDMHTHLREPGREDAETIASGCAAAMAGGFTGVCCMPNTRPVIDNRGQVEFIIERAGSHLVQVYPIGAVTVGQLGEQLTEMADMREAGAVAFSDDGYPVKTAALMRRALEYAKMFNAPIIDHCEELTLTEGKVMHEGQVSTRLGMKGIPSVSEDICIARDLILAEYTKGPLHIAHVSTAGAVSMIRDAKSRGVSVTAETCPHYLVLTDEAVQDFDTNAKMKPPLRAPSDRDALREAVRDGVIDAIATDHAPHTVDFKELEFDEAAFGIIGLETAVGLLLTHLVHKKLMPLKRLVECMAIAPRKILCLEPNRVEKGKPANFTILDLNRPWTVDKERFLSKSRNTPFDGWKLKGRAVGVYHRGQLYSSIDGPGS